MTSPRGTPKPPSGLNQSGKALWNAILREFELTEAERLQLLQACRLSDALDGLQAVIDQDGVTTKDRYGATVPSPALVESRQQRIVLTRLIAALRIPDETDTRPQRRTGVRGTYRQGSR